MNEKSRRNSEIPSVDPARFRALVKASFIAIGADLFLVILKSVLANTTGSAVILADAWHSGGDFAVSFTVLISIIVNHRFRENAWARNAEGLVALLISAVLILGSLKVISGVLGNEAARFTLKPDIPLVIAIAGISLASVIAFAMFRYKRKIGKRHNSIAFTAESIHTYSDFLTSFGVWLTLMLGYFGVHIERLMTFLVGLAVLRIGFKLFLQALRFFNVSLKLRFRWEKLLPGQIREKTVGFWGTIQLGFNRLIEAVTKVRFFREEWLLKNSRRILTVNLFIIALLYIGTGFYAVLPYQTGLELLFGKVQEQNAPGLHYHIPKPFGKVILVDTGVAARVESGFRTVWNFEGQEPEAYLWEFTHSQGRYIRVPEEAIIITGDENLVDVNVLCYYRIVDPVQYALENDNAHELLRSLFCYEVHATMGTYHLDTLLTSGRGLVQEQLKRNMEELVQMVPLGVKILKVSMHEAHPPLEVVPQYRSVASARERKNEIIHEANSYYNNLLPKSRGKARASIFYSEAFAEERTAAAVGAGESFILKQANFSRFKALQKDRLWWEMVEKVMSEKSVIILPSEAKRRIYTSEIKPGDN